MAEETTLINPPISSPIINTEYHQPRTTNSDLVSKLITFFNELKVKLDEIREPEGTAKPQNEQKKITTEQPKQIKNIENEQDSNKNLYLALVEKLLKLTKEIFNSVNNTLLANSNTQNNHGEQRKIVELSQLSSSYANSQHFPHLGSLLKLKIGPKQKNRSPILTEPPEFRITSLD